MAYFPGKCWGPVCFLVVLVVLGEVGQAEEPVIELLPLPGTKTPAEGPALNAANGKRRIYVLHSGVHTVFSEAAKNLAAEGLRDGLEKRGVPAKDLIVLDNPFPTATWKNFIPVDSLNMFLDAAEPSSRVSQDAYRRLHKALQAQGVTAKDEIVWIGHSAGGQMGMTMAHLARNLWRYPDLAKETSSYQFDMVITLGSPVGSNYLPSEVKLRSYYSPEDRVVHWIAKVSPVMLFPLGHRGRINKLPQEVGDNCTIRWFGDVEHPTWDVAQRVLDRIVAETNPAYRPPWHSQLCTPRWGLSLSQLLCQVIEDECHISLEDPPRAR